ncbi:MAG: histidine phosphatase family protein [Pseudomonadota bacterium]
MSDDQRPRRLALLRHAKSDWSTQGEPDHARPLSLRGRLAAPLMGAWLAEQPWRIDLALISDAARTRETWARLAPLLPQTPPIETLEALYLAEPEAMLAALRKAPDKARTVLMIGHNPGLEQFALRLGDAQSPRPGAFPTAALGVFRLDGAAAPSWDCAAFGDFRLEAYEEPKGLV